MDEGKPYGTYAPKGFVRWVIDRTRTFSDGWWGRRGVILLRKPAMWLLGGEPVDIDALGARMRLLPYNNICEKRVLFAPQNFDSAELALLETRIGEGFTFIDIGANVGAYSLFVAARAGRSARILAMEPQPGIYERLIANIQLNAFATIKALDCAVADRAGELTLFIDTNNSGESSVKIVAAGGAAPIKVQAKRLLDIVREEGFERLDAVKLDVEGAEDLILDPFFADAPESLYPGLIIVENGTGRWQIDLPDLLDRHGYRKIAQTRLNLVFERVPPAA
ncbi:FkbM family methyltransferase [Enterovirga rhinocerotis]|uniref:FkbM family methyltransferase n=1 Tax=Enterovirga rhinocerotis TaxID=1339210 RepID=A0A4R7BV90_9HYPH|nr:FkbM family methyltransferase [Enterovirga rhinocerotis]TDR88982.1 FkbM family methyltransferase [Enterovirga rhinocerotis]